MYLHKTVRYQIDNLHLKMIRRLALLQPGSLITSWNRQSPTTLTGLVKNNAVVNMNIKKTKVRF